MRIFLVIVWLFSIGLGIAVVKSVEEDFQNKSNTPTISKGDGEHTDASRQSSVTEVSIPENEFVEPEKDPLRIYYYIFVIALVLAAILVTIAKVYNY